MPLARAPWRHLAGRLCRPWVACLRPGVPPRLASLRKQGCTCWLAGWPRPPGGLTNHPPACLPACLPARLRHRRTPWPAGCCCGRWQRRRGAAARGRCSTLGWRGRPRGQGRKRRCRWAFVDPRSGQPPPGHATQLGRPAEQQGSAVAAATACVARLPRLGARSPDAVCCALRPAAQVETQALDQSALFGEMLNGRVQVRAALRCTAPDWGGAACPGQDAGSSRQRVWFWCRARPGLRPSWAAALSSVGRQYSII